MPGCDFAHAWDEFESEFEFELSRPIRALTGRPTPGDDVSLHQCIVKTLRFFFWQQFEV